uniref:Uncharacterized protein n=1 Tax=Rhizophora mucronata TaxID=61149 RepID=A0A2P2NP74_RHIMU
MARSHRAL